MAAERHFLGFEQPALRSALAYLIDRYRRGNLLRMDNVTVVMSTSRSGRRLNALLSHASQEREFRLFPPRVVTVSHVPELLYEPQFPFASRQVQQYTWAKALRELDAIDRRRLLRSMSANPNALTDDQRWSQKRWVETGRVFWRLYRVLAAEGLRFSDVAKLGRSLDGFPEIERWNAMSALQQRYWALLRDLKLWDKQSARLIAADKKECRFDGELLFLGATDINEALRRMLVQLDGPVVALIHAPASWQARFNELGCLVPAAWQDIEIAIADDQWSIRDNSENQAEEVANEISRFAEDYSADQITIGCADDRLLPYIQRQLSARQASSRAIAGRNVSHGSPFQLLTALGRWLARRRSDEFAQLARHPDLVSLLQRRKIASTWIGELDKYHQRHLSASYQQWLGDPEKRARLEAASREINSLTSEFAGGPRPLTRWVGPLRNFLSEVYRGRAFDRTDPAGHDVLQGCSAVGAALAETAKLPAAVEPTLSAAEAIDTILTTIAQETVVPTPDPEAIEILGWLELPLDDAEALVVAGVHDGTIPQSVTSDQFLPNRLREHLGIDDSARRYARDACILQTLLESRDKTHFVMGRLTEDGDPLRPSRLLLATSGDELVQRWKRVLEPHTSAPSVIGGLAPSTPSGLDLKSNFQIPSPLPHESCGLAMSVSEFKAYVRCPYRYYLNYVLRLRDTDDSGRELDPASYGSVVHDVLEEFGRSALCHSTSATEIRDYLTAQLDATGQKLFGNVALPAVQIQLHQIQSLLDAFAEVQAQRAADGWRIEYVESGSDTPVAFSVDGIDTMLSGRIDRIDQHPETGAWQILDYKTSAKKKIPDKVHQQDGEWVDLQLPLYRHLAAGLGVSGDVALGYFALPTNNDLSVQLANWSTEQLKSADEKARQIIRDVRNQVFWPPKEPASWDEPWDDICLVGVPDALKTNTRS